MTDYARPKKYSVVVDGRMTSISLEPIFLDLLRTAAKESKRSVSSILREVSNAPGRKTNLTSALRCWLLHYQAGLAESIATTKSLASQFRVMPDSNTPFAVLYNARRQAMFWCAMPSDTERTLIRGGSWTLHIDAESNYIAAKKDKRGMPFGRTRNPGRGAQRNAIALEDNGNE